MASEQVEDWTIPARLTDNLDKYYFLHYKALMQLNRAEDGKAFDVAAELVLDRLLPPIYAARCYIILSRDNDDPMFLQHAYEAVRILDEDCRLLVDDAEFPHKMYQQALNLRKEAHKETERRAEAAKLVLEREEAEAETQDAAKQDDEAIRDLTEGTADVDDRDATAEGLEDSLRSGMSANSSIADPLKLSQANNSGALPTPDTVKPSTRMPTNESASQAQASPDR